MITMIRALNGAHLSKNQDGCSLSCEKNTLFFFFQLCKKHILCYLKLSITIGCQGINHPSKQQIFLYCPCSDFGLIQEL